MFKPGFLWSPQTSMFNNWKIASEQELLVSKGKRLCYASWQGVHNSEKSKFTSNSKCFKVVIEAWPNLWCNIMLETLFLSCTWLHFSKKLINSCFKIYRFPTASPITKLLLILCSCMKQVLELNTNIILSLSTFLQIKDRI